MFVVNELQFKSVEVVIVSCFVFISVIKLVEPTKKFSAFKLPSTTISPIISKPYAVNIASSVKAKVLLTISVIESSIAKEPE